MAINLGAITGATQYGLTSPTYNVAADQAPDVNAKQWAVLSTGGTQPGVGTHTISSPFSIAFFRPKSLQILGKPNPTTGLLPNVPKNTFKVITLKGVLPLAGQPNAVMLIRTEISVPAGADLADPLNVRAALSAHIGALQQQSAEIGITVQTGNL